MNSVYDKKWSPYQIVITIACILMIVVTLLPVLNIVAISLSGKNAIAKGLVGVWPKEFTLEAYKMVFQNNNIVHSLFYSIFLTLGSALLSTFMTILAAYPLSKSDLKGRHVFLVLITITMYVGAGIVPNYLLVKELHLMNTIWALVLPGMISPFNLIILRTFFQGSIRHCMKRPIWTGAENGDVCSGSRFRCPCLLFSPSCCFMRFPDGTALPTYCTTSTRRSCIPYSISLSSCWIRCR